MQKIFNHFFAGVMISFLFILFNLTPANANVLSAPSVLKINTYTSYAIDAPVISGVTPSNTNVLVYVNGFFAGNGIVKPSDGPSSSFYFQTSKLEPGVHKVFLVSENKTTLERSNPGTEFDLIVNHLPAPTLVVPNEKTITAKTQPLIEGFTISGTFVHLYIDGVYNGKTKIVEHESGTAHFSYNPFLNLAVGKHTMWAVAEDARGRKSKVSEHVTFNIEKQMVAPTLVGKVENQINYKKPIITGLARNDSRIKIFIDHKVAGEFLVNNHVSGTANFAFVPSFDLGLGNHLIYAVAFDTRGKESKWSNLLSIRVEDPMPAISPIAESEDKKESEGTTTKKEDEKKTTDSKDSASKDDKDEDTKDESEQDREEEKNGKDEQDEDIDEKDEEDEAGSVTETNDSQGKLGWNAIIFLLFLVAVIAWIFWVNRELIKEKREQEEKEKNSK